MTIKSWCSERISCTEFKVDTDLLCKHCYEGQSLHVENKCLWDCDYYQSISCLICDVPFCVCIWQNDTVSRSNISRYNGVLYVTHAWCRSVIITYLHHKHNHFITTREMLAWVVNNIDEARKVSG